MPTPTTHLTWKIALADGRAREIRWSNRSVYRLQTLPGGYDLESVSDDRRGVATLAELLWSMLEPKDRLPSPEDVAELLPMRDEARLREIMAAVNDAIETGQKGSESKNGSGGPSLTPANSAD